MKLNVKYRYIIWTVSGFCWSCSVRPIPLTTSCWTLQGMTHAEDELSFTISPEETKGLFFDTESEDDMMLLRTLLEL